MFQNKTVLITGGASGIGLLCGKCFAGQGANVMLADLDRLALSVAVQEIGVDRADHFVVDVTNYAQVVACCRRTVDRFGSIDMLVTCAGGAETRLRQQSGPFWELPIDTIDFGIDLNLKGAIYFFHAAMGQMVRQRSGVIICLGSITGEEGDKGSLAYAAAKSALMNGVVKSLALAGEDHGVRACCVAPGPVLTRPAMANMKTLLGRAAEPQEIVDMILYLASDRAAFITGTTFLIDGGRNIMKNKE